MVFITIALGITLICCGLGIVFVSGTMLAYTIRY